MKYLEIEGDTNDADYVTQRTPITNEELEQFMPVIEAIKAFKPYSTKVRDFDWKHSHNYPREHREDLGEKPIEEIYSHVDQELLALFDEKFVPYGYENTPLYTITEISTFEILNHEVLFRGGR